MTTNKEKILNITLKYVENHIYSKSDYIEKIKKYCDNNDDLDKLEDTITDVLVSSSTKELVVKFIEKYFNNSLTYAHFMITKAIKYSRQDIVLHLRSRYHIKLTTNFIKQLAENDNNNNILELALTSKDIEANAELMRIFISNGQINYISLLCNSYKIEPSSDCLRLSCWAKNNNFLMIRYFHEVCGIPLYLGFSDIAEMKDENECLKVLRYVCEKTNVKHLYQYVVDPMCFITKKKPNVIRYILSNFDINEFKKIIADEHSPTLIVEETDPETIELIEKNCGYKFLTRTEYHDLIVSTKNSKQLIPINAET